MDNNEKWALHAVIFKKPYDIEKAKEEVKEFIKDGKKQFYRETVKSYRFRNIPKQKFIKSQFKTKKINKEISLVFGKLKDEHHHLEGAGIADFIYKPIKAIKEHFKPRKGYNNSTTKYLKSFGDLPIKSLQIVRTPILNVIDKALNVVSFGKWSKLKKEYSFDKLFHLALVANVGSKNLVIEKNEVINVSTSYKMSKDSEVMDVPLNGKNFTTNDMLQKTRQRLGDSKYFLYDGFKNNCQVFVRECLISEDLYNEREKNFLFQDLEELAKKMPSLSKKIMNITTDLGASVNKLTGQAKRKFATDEIKQAENDFWKQNQAIKNKLSMETNEANKPFMEEQRKKKDEVKAFWNSLFSFLEAQGFDRNSGQSYLDFIEEIKNTKGFSPFPKKNKINEWEWKKTKDIPITLEDLGAGGKFLKAIGLGDVTTGLLNVYNTSVKVAEKPTLGKIVDVGKAGVEAVKSGLEAHKSGVKGAIKTGIKNVAKEAMGGAKNMNDLLKMAEENEKEDDGKTFYEVAMDEIGKNFNTKGKPKKPLTLEPEPEQKAQPKAKAQPKKKEITGKAQEKLLIKEFKAKEKEFKKQQKQKEKEQKAKERELKRQKNLKIYYGIDEIPKGYRRASMEEAMKKKKINYWGLKKVDNKILMITDEVPDKKKLSDLLLILAKNKGIFDKLKKEYNQQTALNKNTSEIKQQLEDAKKTLIKSNNEYQELKKKLK